MKKKLITIIMVAATIFVLAGCQKQYEVANYQGKLEKGENKSDYNRELFYRNDKKTIGADPFILDNTERDGYYYQYVTEGTIFCYRSKDLMDWEPVRNTLDIMKYEEDGSSSEFRRVAYADVWAAEVIYDAEEELYYMFFSATPQEDTSVTGIESGTGRYLMLVATSKYPDRDFKLVDFTDADSCGKENIRSYDTVSYPHYYAKYLLFDPTAHAEFCKADKEYGGYAGYIAAIDPHPFVDDNGDKYLFWSDQYGTNRMCVVKMKNWLTPDWSSATSVLWANYYNEEDYRTAKNGKEAQTVSYELENIGCNEGAAVVKHKDKYYLTFSVNYYGDNSYQVAQAVADHPLGPYRKLTEAEGGIVISGSIAGSQEISGTGHHSFVTVGDSLYIVYHRHNDFVLAGGARNAGIDEVKWVTIKDQNGKDLDVMYTNGPTCTVQPRLEAFSEYRNIANEAKVSGASDVIHLTDGLLSIYKYANENFMKYIQETTISDTTTFTFDFEEARTVRAIMIYNSKDKAKCFGQISRVEMVCEENGKEVTRFIKNLEFSSEYYKANELTNEMYYVVSGAASYAEFEELNVKSIRITVEIPEGQQAVGISEIKILGQ